MRRREFVTLVVRAAALWPGIALAQQPAGKVWRIAYLHPETLDHPAARALFDAFRAEMRALGYIEDKNLVIDSRNGEGKAERLPSLVTELVTRRPDVIVAVATPTIAAAQRATSTIPIVMAPATDPVRSGFIKSLAHPGGNITGMANMFGDAVGKSVELLHSILPSAKRIAVLMSTNPTHPQQYELVEAAAKTFDLTVVRVMAPTPDDLEQAFDRMRQENCDALFVLADPTRPKIVSLAAKARLPAFYQLSTFVDLGGLASYGPDLKPVYRKVAHYVDKIFKGANPAGLPVEQPVVFEFALNVKTAAALGLTIPDTILARTDKVIE
ncbi:ABC transporter substrate-binding protein [Bradyrhizobium sp. AUGA SZCCT0240]|uniref:ABC transporter substrate-binding protein n=1 Tax=Bradyrhizobium sp. AUGA SZCCT0240 TaxID=2807669 RepID=UPI001BA99AC2|nr:ABC transporter substrate-binding protein [Bradyrhizobium sp. AUGA SZCCT0240]MBR1254996.1 ABC transporter substrate-binding protein [Bradyrhizobium sp. AUGA SZCCT0240]